MGRSGIEVKQIAALIPKGSIDQGIWKTALCAAYGHGEPLAEAVALATATVRETNPGFEARHELPLGCTP